MSAASTRPRRCGLGRGRRCAAPTCSLEAALTVFVLACNTVLRPLVNAINRAPIDEQASEATSFVKLAVDAPAGAGLRDQVVERLEAAHYPVADVEAIERGDLQEIIATLSAPPLSQGTRSGGGRLAAKPRVRHATWESSTKD